VNTDSKSHSRYDTPDLVDDDTDKEYEGFESLTLSNGVEQEECFGQQNETVEKGDLASTDGLSVGWSYGYRWRSGNWSGNIGAEGTLGDSRLEDGIHPREFG
jgi:hypothetical protein